MHYEGHGDALQLAKALRQALSASGTPLGGAGAASPGAAGPGLDTKQIEQVLGRSGRDIGGGVFQVTAPRAEAITAMGWPLLPAMGVTTVMNFQPTADGKAAITGDFVLVDKEVNPVALTLRQHGIDVTALHNHGLQDTPGSGARSMPSSRNSSSPIRRSKPSRASCVAPTRMLDSLPRRRPVSTPSPGDSGDRQG